MRSVVQDVRVDAAAAIQIIDDAIAGIDEFDTAYIKIKNVEGALFDRYWTESLAVEQSVVLPRLELARQVADHVGADAHAVAAPPNKSMYATHPYEGNRNALVILRTRLATQERMAEILRPTGPQLSTDNLHPTLWDAAAHLFDDGYYRQAVQTAAQALEGLLQAIAGPEISGESLARLFSESGDGVRLHFGFLDPNGRTYTSAQQGTASLIRGAMMGVRNLVSHPEWPEPDELEALEMLAALSYVAHLVDRAERTDIG
jgi:hypothetical protein